MAQQPPGGFGSRSHGEPPHAGPPRTPKGMSTGAIIALTVVMVIVVLVGTLGVLAVVGFRRYISRAKTAEVMNTVGQISKVAAARYEASERLCPSAVEPVPKDESYIQKKKYASAPSDWHPERKDAGFGCLAFSFEYPQYYQYDYRSTGSSFEAIGRGDLDGNGIFSRYARGGRVVGRDVALDAALTIENDGE